MGIIIRPRVYSVSYTYLDMLHSSISPLGILFFPRPMILFSLNFMGYRFSYT